MAAGNLQPVRVIARLLDLTERRVQQLASEGIIPKASRGKYDLVESVRRYIGQLRLQVEASPSGKVTVLEDERARLTRAKADLAELDERERRDELVPAVQIEKFLLAILSRVRQGVLTLPSRAAPKAHDAKTIPQVERIILDCCHEVLKEISETEIDFKTIPVRGAGSRADRAAGVPDPRAPA